MVTTMTTTMTAIHPRRTERITLRRNVQLVFRGSHGRVDSVPAATYSVSCHGAGLYAQHEYPMGSEVFVIDSQSGVGAWARLVWEGKQMNDGRIPLGVEFQHPANYWKTRLVPPSWLPFVCGRSYTHPSSDRMVVVGKKQAQSSSAEAPTLALVGESCRCCGTVVEVSRVANQEPLCRVCRQWPG